MDKWIGESLFFGVVISLIGYEIGLLLKRKFKWAVFNPLLLAIVFVMAVLGITQVDYDSYYEGARYLSYLMTPVTVCLAIPLYEQLELLKKNTAAIITGIAAGVLASLCSVLLFARLFHFSYEEYVTLLPKSITTAIGMSVSEELGGVVTITVAVIIVTGVIGNMTAEFLFRITHIEEAAAKGIALGTSAHALGTVRAMELGEAEGAMSSLAIAVAGLLTVAGASVFARLY